jgi:tripartite-type tricarboxylate transporter receptor subunit TctC
LLRWPTSSTVAAEIKRPEAAVAIIRAFGAALLGFAMAVSAAGAQDYPTQTIKLIVPFLAGGPVDALARVVAQHLQNRVGQNVIVENRSGGGTTIGAKAVAAAPPDGYTLLVVGPNIAYYPVLFPNLDFDPDKALARIATLVTWSHLIAVAPSVPANSIPELVAYAKANPGKLAFGYGLATMPHIIGETFKQATGIDIIDVPYRGGEQARADLLGGRVHINIAPVPQLLQLIRDGKMRALAYTGPQRSPELPDVLTISESGYPQVGFNPDVWMGILAPAGTPSAIVDKLNRDVNAVLKSDEMAPALKRFGYEAKITTPAEFETFFAAELRKWPPILTATGLKPQ